MGRHDNAHIGEGTTRSGVVRMDVGVLVGWLDSASGITGGLGYCFGGELDIACGGVSG